MGCSSTKAVPINEACKEEDSKLILRKEISAPVKFSTHKVPQISSEEKQENFIIVKKIGNNNICHSYLIRSTETNEEYAYKKIDISDANDESVKRIKNDVEMLDNPFFYDFPGFDDDSLYDNNNNNNNYNF